MSHSLLPTTVNILRWLEADVETPHQARVERDRAIGKLLQQGDTPREFRQVLAWWDAISCEDTSRVNSRQPGERLVALISLATGLLVLVGVVVGAGVAGAILGYKGDTPVNLFALLGVLVGLPLVMMIGSLLLMKGQALIPGSLRDAMGVLSPGRWVGRWLERHTPVDMFETVSHRPMRGGFARWQLLAFGQSFAIGFFMGVLFVALLLIVFTDLAFGWSTTLAMDANFVWRVMHTISLPWSNWMPVAVPDPGLVEASRFYRLEAGTVDAVRAAELGRWWPFVLMTILVYGLLPRVLLAVFSNWQVYKATRRLLEEGPEITALLDRLRAPNVAFEGPDGDETFVKSDESAALAQLEITQGSAIIIWNDALDEDQVSAWLSARGASHSVLIRAAEWQSATEQRKLLQNLPASPATSRGLNRLIILTKGWEPPLLAFDDYVALIRDILGNEPIVVVVPLDISGNAIRAEDRAIWAHALAGHTRLYIASVT